MKHTIFDTCFSIKRKRGRPRKITVVGFEGITLPIIKKKKRPLRFRKLNVKALLKDSLAKEYKEES